MVQHYVDPWILKTDTILTTFFLLNSEYFVVFSLNLKYECFATIIYESSEDKTLMVYHKLIFPTQCIVVFFIRRSREH